MLNAEPWTVSIRNIDSTAGSSVSQSKESFQMSTEVKSEVKGQANKEPLQTLQSSVSNPEKQYHFNEHKPSGNV